MTTTHVAQGASTALLVAGRSDQKDLEALLNGMGYQTLIVDSTDRAHVARDPVSLCLIDLRENGDAIRSARALRTQYPQSVVIGVADPARPSAAADAIRAGVFDVLPRPPSARDLEAILANAREQATLASTQVVRPSSEPMAYGMVGTSPAMRLVMDLVQRAASGRCGMLISGERGTGREMIAHAIHLHGTNRNAPFVKVDC